MTLTNDIAELSGVVNLTSADVTLDTDGRDCSFKAYIPPERKIPGVGGWRWAVHPTPVFCVTQRKIYQHVGIFCVS